MCKPSRDLGSPRAFKAASAPSFSLTIKDQRRGSSAGARASASLQRAIASSNLPKSKARIPSNLKIAALILAGTDGQRDLSFFNFSRSLLILFVLPWRTLSRAASNSFSVFSARTFFNSAVRAPIMTVLCSGLCSGEEICACGEPQICFAINSFKYWFAIP